MRFVIQVMSREEASEWTRRLPDPVVDGEIEVRQLHDMPPGVG